jgi:hypothetical protein
LNGPIILEKGLGKDGHPNHPYVRRYPTNYRWVPRLTRLAFQLVNEPKFKGRIWACTYRQHPPANPHPMLSLDVWGFGGRGDPLAPDLGWEVWDYLYKDPKPPHMWWGIWAGSMQTRLDQIGPIVVGSAPDGPPGSDAGHFAHIHWTIVELWAQRILNG